MKNKKILNCWVLSLRVESMLDKYMEDGCTFDLTVTQRLMSFGTMPWRKVSVDIGEGANADELEIAVRWLNDATHGNVIFN